MSWTNTIIKNIELWTGLVLYSQISKTAFEVGMPKSHRKTKWSAKYSPNDRQPCMTHLLEDRWLSTATHHAWHGRLSCLIVVCLLITTIEPCVALYSTNHAPQGMLGLLTPSLFLPCSLPSNLAWWGMDVAKGILNFHMNYWVHDGMFLVKVNGAWNEGMLLYRYSLEQ